MCAEEGAAARGAGVIPTRTPTWTRSTVAEVGRSISPRPFGPPPRSPPGIAFHRVTIAHAAVLPSRCCCVKPRRPARRVVAGRLTTAASSTERCRHASAPNRRAEHDRRRRHPDADRRSCPEANTGPGPPVWRGPRHPQRAGWSVASGGGIVAMGGSAMAGSLGAGIRSRQAPRRSRRELRLPLPGAESARRAQSPSRARGGDSRCSPTGTSARRPTCRSNRATRCVRRWSRVRGSMRTSTCSGALSTKGS